MRGISPIPFPVPAGGWRTDMPVYEVPPDALADGLNMIVDRAGILTPRGGLDPLPTQIDVQGEPDPRLMGIATWSETASEQVVLSTLTHWWAIVGGGFVDITPPGDPQSVEPAVPTRFAQFGIVNGQSALYGVNGSLHNLMRRWVVGDPTYTTMVAAGQGNFTLAASDLAVVSNRLVAVDTAESGILFPRRVRWSDINDGSSWHPLAFEDLQGDAGNIVAIEVAPRLTAIIYCQAGAWILSATGGDDAGAFQLDRLQGAYAAPYTPAAIVNVGGVHYYAATDGHIWRCDGQQAAPISGAIDAGLRARLATGSDQKPAVLYDAPSQFIWFFLTFAPDTDPFNAIPLDLIRQTWGVPQHFPVAVTTASFKALEQFGPTWDNPGVDANGNDYTWDSAPWASWNAIPESFAPVSYVGLANGLLVRFGTAATDNGVAIPFSATWGLRTPQDATERLEVNTVDVYLKPVSDELLRVAMDALRTPYDPVPINILDEQIAQDQPDQWLIQLDRMPAVPSGAFRMGNFMRCTIDGSAQAGAPQFAGLVAYAFATKRPDILGDVTDNA